MKNNQIFFFYSSTQVIFQAIIKHKDPILPNISTEKEGKLFKKRTENFVF